MFTKMAFKSYFEAQVLGGLLELEEYLKTTEKYLLDVTTDRGAWLDEQAEALPPEERNEFYERNIDFYRAYADIFPMILRNSFLVSALSLLDHKMWRFYKQLKRENLIQSSWDNIKGSFFEPFKKCCKEARLPLSFGDTTWQEIKKYYLVRNCIVHNSGLIKGAKHEQQLRAYVAKRNLISNDTIQEEIALTEKFCEEVIKTIRAFLMKTYEAYYDELQRQKQKPDN